MAIIKCPECGQQISNTAKACIHCGCEFSICKECESIIVGSPKECPVCGFALKEKEKQTEDDIYEIVSKWERETPFLKNSLFFPIISILLGLSLLFLVIAAVGLFSWANGNALEGIMNSKDVLSSRKTLIIISGICFALSSLLTQFQVYMRTSSLQLWSYKNKIDLLPSIKKGLEFDFTSITVDEISSKSGALIAAIRAKKYENDLATKNRERNIAIFATAGTVLAIVLVSFFFISNVEIYMSHIILSSDKFKLSSLENIFVLILGIAVYIIKYIVTEFLDKSITKSEDAWIKKNLPENHEAYEKYVKNLSDLIIANVE